MAATLEMELVLNSRRDPSGRELLHPMPSARAALHAILAYSRRSRVLITTLTLTLGIGAGFVPAAPADPGENVTKAEMLWNVAKFIQWPDSPAPQAHGQLVFTILGEDDLAAELPEDEPDTDEH